MPKQKPVYYCPICVKFYLGRRAMICHSLGHMSDIVRVKDKAFEQDIIDDMQRLNRKVLP